VTAHCPGATATEFAGRAGNAKTPLFAMGVADAKGVARHGYRAMHAGQVVAVHGPVNKLGAFGLRFSPRFAVRRMVAWINTPRG
jgi:short-subunit dehydrogenase